MIRKTLVYVAGPYSAPDEQGIEDNIWRARRLAVELIRRGYAVICPHCNTIRMEREFPGEEGQRLFYEMDLEILSRCDAICMMAGWQESTGARLEFNTAIGNNPDWPDVDLTVMFEGHLDEIATGADDGGENSTATTR